MVEENNVSSLQQHLKGGTAAAIETALNLKATVGFPYSEYEYRSYDWNSELEYDRFVEFGKTASSVSGRVFDSQKETAYETTIISYNGKYYVQVEREWDFGGGTDYFTEAVDDYLSALKYAYSVMIEN